MCADVRRRFRELRVLIGNAHQHVRDVVLRSAPAAAEETETAVDVEVIYRVVLVRREIEAVLHRVVPSDPREVIEEPISVVNERGGAVATESNAQSTVQTELRRAGRVIGSDTGDTQFRGRRQLASGNCLERIISLRGD